LTLDLDVDETWRARLEHRPVRRDAGGRHGGQRRSQVIESGCR
jgi:hypothetical protein